MSKPNVLSGKFSAGVDLVCGDNVVIEVAEECVVGDRCTLADNTYLCGRSIRIGDDFYGYRWSHPAGCYSGISGRWMEVGRGRLDEEHACLTVGHRNTWHDVRVDLAAPVVVGNDVGISPECTIYTHHYWMSVLDGYPQRVDRVEIGNGTILGYRSTVLAGARVGENTVIGAQSVVSGVVLGGKVWGGNPLRMLKEDIKPYPSNIKAMLLKQFAEEYQASCKYRGFSNHVQMDEYPILKTGSCSINVETRTLTGTENELSDDLRWFLFKKGIRIYTKRRFKARWRS